MKDLSGDTGSFSSEGIERGIRKFSGRKTMWETVLGDIGDALKQQRDILRTQEEDFQRLKRQNKSAQALIDMVDTDAKYHASHTLSGGLGNRFNPLTPSNASIAEFSGVPLKQKIAKSKELKGNIADPMATITLSERQREMSANIWNKFEKSIQKGDMKAAEKAVNGSAFSFADKTYSRYFNRRRYKNMLAVEQQVERARKVIPYFKEAHRISKPLEASIKAEYKAIGTSIAKLAKKGGLKEFLGKQSDAEIAANPVLGVLKDIVENNDSLTATSIARYMRENEIVITHKEIHQGLSAAQQQILKAREEAKEAREDTKIREKIVRGYSKKLARMAERETTMSMNGKRQDIADLIEAFGQGKLSDEETEKLNIRIQGLEADGLIGPAALSVIERSIEIMSRPDFDPETLPEKELDGIIAEQRAAYFHMHLQETLYTAGKWAGEAKEKIKKYTDIANEKLQRTTDKAGEAYLRANMAFYDAVRKNVTHPVESAYHNVNKAAKSAAASLSASLDLNETPDVPVWMTVTGKGDKSESGYYAEHTGAELQPSVFAAATSADASGKGDDGSQGENGAIDTDIEYPDDQLTEDTDTANSPERLI